MKIAVVFPGWGAPKKLYQKLNLVVDKKIIITRSNLSAIKDKLAKYKYEELVFCGWSLGAMRALEYIEHFAVDKLILLAPTLYFLGDQPKIIVKKMKRNLRVDKLKTLIKFSKLNFASTKEYSNYLREYKEELNKLDKKHLEQGLNFLLEKDLRNLNFKTNIRPLIIVGEEDQVVNNSSSKRVLDKFSSGDYFSLSNVGHNLIYEAEEKVKQLIMDYFR